MLCLYISSNSIIVLILFSPMFLFDSALTQHCYGLQKRVSTTKRNIAHVHKNTNTLSLGNVGTEVYRCNTQFLVKVSFFLTKLTDFFDSLTLSTKYPYDLYLKPTSPLLFICSD
jgi:hypothetical protein